MGRGTGYSEILGFAGLRVWGGHDTAHLEF